jgi:TatD DNase family protein
MNKIIDSHAHLGWESFADDQDEVIKRAFDKGVVQIVQAGVDLKTIPDMLSLCDKYADIYTGIGLHPHDAKLWDENSLDVLKSHAKHPKVVAIGECGLDFHYNFSERETQIAVFVEQIKLAKELNLPLIIHTRNAWEDTFHCLNKYGQGQIRGVFHCFTGTINELPQIQALDFYISFSGILTFAKSSEIQEVAKIAPGKRILVETDCPYLAPQGFRGKRNEPSYIWTTAEKLALLRNESIENIAAITVNNTRELFKLPELTKIEN